VPTLSRIDARRARTLPSYRDFVDDALFHPRWGYYSTGAVRFGEGGHYDTFPTALSPLFGEMVAAAARRAWNAAGRPRTFEVCEVGAGNGQLCCDVVATVATRAGDPAWRAFARAFRYRVIERSPALVARQRAKLGPLAASVRWTRTDLSRRRGRLRLGRAGFVVANEVLDCLAHHKVVRGADGRARVVFIEATARSRTLDRPALARVLATDGAPDRTPVRYREVALPLAAAPGLARFLAHYVPERLVMPRPCPAYFACPELPVLVRAVGRLYDRAETLWIDYGDLRPFHLRAPERRRVFAGPPRSNRRIYEAPGRDDITFMVDFSVAARAARDAGLDCTYWGGQIGLVRASGVRVGRRRAIARIAQARAASWLLDVVGVGPERAWRQGGLTWTKPGAKGGGLETGIGRDLDELLGKRPSRFRMLAISSGPTVFRASDRRRARRTGC
jgi:SAM-dependent MidA family methyltransferase